MEQPGFWDDIKHSTEVSRELKSLEDQVDGFNKLSSDFDDMQELVEMAEEENDASMVEEIQNMLEVFTKEFDDYRVKLLLSDEFDNHDAVLTLHAGAGGTEACDWVSMLYRMYTRWAEKKGYKVELLDYLEGDEAGIKSFKSSDEVFDFIDDYKEENSKTYDDIFNEIAEAINEEGFFKSKMTKEEMEQKISNPLSKINTESIIKASAEKAVAQIVEKEILT